MSQETSRDLKVLFRHLIQNISMTLLINTMLGASHFFLEHEPDQTVEGEKWQAWSNLKEDLDSASRSMTQLEFRHYYLGVQVSRDVNSFQSYVTQMIRRIFTERPETLKSPQEVQLHEVLGFSSMGELIAFYAERKAEKLSYRNFRDVINELNRNFGLDFSTDTAEFLQVCEYIEVRNIVVHNFGRVSKTFLQRTQRSDLTESDLFPLTPEYATDGNKSLMTIAKKLDKSILNHFRLDP